MAGSCSMRKKKSKEVLYSEEFQALLDRLEEEDKNYNEEDEEEEEEEELGVNRRRRKLRPNQVKALEAMFEAERRLGPTRKVAIAAELGMEPRQVAVWFQNRRARCKTKQLEREFSRLQAAHNTLSQDYNSLDKETQSLVAEVNDLQAKVQATNTGSSGDMGSNVNVGPAMAELVAPEMMERLMYVDTTPPLLQTWPWSRDDGYVNGERGVTSLTWDAFSFDQSTYF